MEYNVLKVEVKVFQVKNKTSESLKTMFSLTTLNLHLLAAIIFPSIIVYGKQTVQALGRHIYYILNDVKIRREKKN